MKIKSMKCPECGAIVNPEDGLSSFYCMHCGCQLVLDEQSKELIKAKVRLKELESKTEQVKMAYADKKDERKHKLEESDKNFKQVLLLWAAIFAVIIVVFGGMMLSHNIHTNNLENKIIEIQQDIDNGNFNEAETKIESLQDDDYSFQDKYRWWKTRRTLRKQLKEAKKNADND